MRSCASAARSFNVYRRVLNCFPWIHSLADHDRMSTTTTLTHASPSCNYGLLVNRKHNPRSVFLQGIPQRRAEAGNHGMPHGFLNHRGGETRMIHVNASGAAGNFSAPQEYPLTPVLTSVAVASAGAFAFGYHLGVVNGPLEAIASDLGFAGNKALEGLVVSSTLAGAALGSLSGGNVSDALGRRKGFLLATIPLLVGPLLSASAASFETMVAGRALVGLGIGLTSALVPTYISEVAPTRLRGTLGTINQLMICVGILAALVVNVAVPVSDWRTMFALAVGPALVLGLGMLGAPESPRWLNQKGQAASAEIAARKLWGPSGGLELQAATDKATAGGKEAAVSLFSGDYRKPVLIGILLFMFQQLAGINALVYFSTSVFRQAGVASDTLASAAVGVTNVVGTLIAATLMERAGRKQLLTNSFMGQAFAMLAMAAGFGLPALKEFAATIAVVGTLFYILSFATGAGPVPALIVPEISPAIIRGRAVAAAFVSHWVFNVAVGQTFIGAVSQYGLSSVYAFFGVMALLGALYVQSQVPETKGKSFEQIQSELKAKP